MIKVITKSPLFQGDVEVVYNKNKELESISFEVAELSELQKSFFKNKVALKFTTIEDFAKQFGEGKFTCVLGHMAITFDMFWDEYQKKINKDRCVKLWKKLTEAEMFDAYRCVKKYKSFCNKTGRFVADPETYLAKRYFESEWKV